MKVKFTYLEKYVPIALTFTGEPHIQREVVVEGSPTHIQSFYDSIGDSPRVLDLEIKVIKDADES